MIAFETADENVKDALKSIKVHEQSGKHFTPAEVELADESVRT